MRYLGKPNSNSTIAVHTEIITLARGSASNPSKKALLNADVSLINGINNAATSADTFSDSVIDDPDQQRRILDPRTTRSTLTILEPASSLRRACVDAHVVAPSIVYGQHDAAVAFMGIAGVNIYAGTIIVYIIAGMANTDKRGSNLTHDHSLLPRVLSCLETR